MTALDWEMVAVIVSIWAGFGSIAYQLGKRNTELTNLKDSFEDHEEKTDEKWAEQGKVNQSIQASVSKIETALAHGDEKFKHVEKTLDRMDRSLEYLRNERTGQKSRPIPDVDH